MARSAFRRRHRLAGASFILPDKPRSQESRVAVHRLSAERALRIVLAGEKPQGSGYANERVSTLEHSSARAWLALSFVEKLKRRKLIELVRRAGSAPALIEAGQAELRRLGADPDQARVIASFGEWQRVDLELERMAKACARIIPWDSPSYPPLLRHIHDPPLWLAVKGRGGLTGSAVAVVGSRMASPYGLEVAESLATGLARAGVGVISGLARGIDAASHRAALRAAGTTLAVLGSSVDVIYPPEHRKLAEEVAERGALISEFPLGTLPRPSHFPRRNRIIAGMALGVVVVEASERSGALITAKLALDGGREVFAVPGRIDSPLSRGTNSLIKQGAGVVTSVEDIITALPLPSEMPFTADQVAGGDRSCSDPSLELFCAGPLTADQFVEASGLGAAQAAAKLIELELAGWLRRGPGERFELVKRR